MAARLPPPTAALRAVASLAVFPAAAGLAFLVQSRLTVGHWFVTGGFYVADNPDTGRPFKTIGSIWWASHHLNGYGVLLWAAAGAAAVLVDRARARGPGPHRSSCSRWAASAALPWYAFFIGHPFRFRYMIPLVPALAVWAGIGVGLAGRAPVWLPQRCSPRSSSWRHTPSTRQPPWCSKRSWTGSTAGSARWSPATCGRIGTARRSWRASVRCPTTSRNCPSIGVNVRDVVHEGNGDLWAAATARPWAHVGWVVIEELAEGGDVLARRARAKPDFLAGFTRVAEGGGVALYERTELTARGQ